MFIKYFTIFLLGTLSLFSEERYEETDEDRAIAEAYFSLNWKNSKTHLLTVSNATLNLPSGYWILVGDEAIRALELRGWSDIPKVEAIVQDETFANLFVLSYEDLGYFSPGYIDKIDAKAFLDEIRDKTEQENEEKRKLGETDRVHVNDWVKKPTHESQSNVISWAFEVTAQDEIKVINSSAVKLGRFGIERFEWIKDRESFEQSNKHLLDQLVQGYNFNADYRYSDHKAHDKIADFEALGFVSLGGKIVGGSILWALIKKLWGVIFLGTAGLIYHIKRLFNKMSPKTI